MERTPSTQARRTSQTPLFITKLMEIVEDDEISQIICWTSGGDSFVIKNISRFTDEVLPQYFKHRNFSSFIRQLNMYSFRKIRHPQGQNVYCNQNFKRHNKGLIRNISRKMRQQQRMVVYQGRGKTPINMRQIGQLKAKQKGLEEMCRHFLTQNQRLIQENRMLIRKMEEESREKQRRLEEFLVMMVTQGKALPGVEGEMLSISNAPHGQVVQDQNNNRIGLGQLAKNQTTLQALSNRIRQSQQYPQIKKVLQAVYGKQNQKRKERSFTVVPAQQPQKYQSQIHKPLSQNQQGIGLDAEDNSFISINDFLNADDYDNINLQQSR